MDASSEEEDVSSEEQDAPRKEKDSSSEEKSLSGQKELNGNPFIKFRWGRKVRLLTVIENIHLGNDSIKTKKSF